MYVDDIPEAARRLEGRFWWSSRTHRDYFRGNLVTFPVELAWLTRHKTLYIDTWGTPEGPNRTARGTYNLRPGCEKIPLKFIGDLWRPEPNALMKVTGLAMRATRLEKLDRVHLEIEEAEYECAPVFHRLSEPKTQGVLAELERMIREHWVMPTK